MKYIAYGSNMVKEQMAYRCPGAKLIGTGYLPNHRLAFYLHATVERSRARDARVPVAVWEIDEADEQRLDRYEGFPNYYVKLRRRVVLSDGSEIEGMVYVMILIRRQPPTAEYYRANPRRVQTARLPRRNRAGAGACPLPQPGAQRLLNPPGPIHAAGPPSLRGAGLFGFCRAWAAGRGACPGRRLRAKRAPTWAA